MLATLSGPAAAVTVTPARELVGLSEATNDQVVREAAAPALATALAGPGVTILSSPAPSLQGPPEAAGTFAGAGALGITAGVVLSSGESLTLEGTQSQLAGELDADDGIVSAALGEYFDGLFFDPLAPDYAPPFADASVLEFDFSCAPGATAVRYRYVFATDDDFYEDALVIRLNGVVVSLAALAPIVGPGARGPSAQSDEFSVIDNVVATTQADAWTSVVEVVLPIVDGPNHLELSVADDTGSLLPPDVTVDSWGLLEPLECVTHTCGNGVLEPGEACDDGNASAGDCCTGQCRIERRSLTLTREGGDITDIAWVGLSDAGGEAVAPWTPASFEPLRLLGTRSDRFPFLRLGGTDEGTPFAHFVGEVGCSDSLDTGSSPSSLVRMGGSGEPAEIIPVAPEPQPTLSSPPPPDTEAFEFSVGGETVVVFAARSPAVPLLPHGGPWPLGLAAGLACLAAWRVTARRRFTPRAPRTPR